MRFLLCFSLLFVALTAPAAEPAAELAGFSVFPQIDPAALLSGEPKLARGPAMSGARDLSVQSCCVVPVAPAAALATLRGSNPTAHHDNRVYLHNDLPGAPGPGNFGGLKSAPSNSAVSALISKTLKGSPELQISKDEAKKLPSAGSGMTGPVADFWAGVLGERAASFVSGGASRQPAYDFATDGGSPGRALAGLMSQQGKVRGQFSAFLSESGVTGGRPAKPELYWELLNVEDEGVLTLGSFSSRATAGGFQAGDVLYYASGGYDVALTLYQAWPIDVGGKPATLIWRGDFISAAYLASLHGVEKLAAESAMMKDITKSVNQFKKDSR